MALQDDTDGRHGACLAQDSRGVVDESALFGCGVLEFVLFVVDAFFERCYLLVAGAGVAFGPFGGAVERIDARAGRFEVEQSAAHFGEVGRVTTKRRAAETSMPDRA